MFNNLFEFYRSDEWRSFREIIIDERTKDDGFIYDEMTDKPILKKYDIVLHHKTELTEENVFDYNISLNPENIMVLSHRSHNYIHDKFGHSMRQVYLVYGAPLSGKTTYVHDNMSEGDLIIDMDNIWQCVSGCDRYIKPNRLRSVVFRLRDDLLDMVKYRFGKWSNAYVLGGYPLSGERERLLNDLSAREIFIDTSKDECLARLQADEQRDHDEWTQYIDEWFERFNP